MALPKGIDIVVLGDQVTFGDYIERTAVIGIIHKSLKDHGFQDVGLVYGKDDLRPPSDFSFSVFDAAVRYMPSILKTPITIATHKPNRDSAVKTIDSNDVIIDRMHKKADKESKFYLRSRSKNFPL
jgi:hypothetical protein